MQTILTGIRHLWKSKTFLDVGCGGGILAEAIYDKGAEVTGIDAAGPG